MMIGEAVQAMREGRRVGRAGWNGKGMYVYLQTSALPWLPFVVMKTVDGRFVPWLCSQTDLLADDWEVVA